MPIPFLPLLLYARSLHLHPLLSFSLPHSSPLTSFCGPSPSLCPFCLLFLILVPFLFVVVSLWRREVPCLFYLFLLAPLCVDLLYVALLLLLFCCPPFGEGAIFLLVLLCLLFLSVSFFVVFFVGPLVLLLPCCCLPSGPSSFYRCTSPFFLILLSLF